jgi:hypothetical protein
MYDLLCDIFQARHPGSLQDALLAMPSAKSQLVIRNAPSTAASSVDGQDRLTVDFAHEDRRELLQCAEQFAMLIRNWTVFHHARMDEVDRFVSYTDWSELRARLEEGRGAVLVGSHFGLRPVQELEDLARGDLPFKAITNVWPATFLYPGKMLRAKAGSLILAQMVGHLRKGGVLFTPGDLPQEQAFRTVAIGQRQQAMSSGPPSLAYVAQVQTYWYNSLWRNGRIEFELCPGPAPGDSKTLDTWLDRWFDFYRDRIAATLRSAPENQVGLKPEADAETRMR